MNIGKSESKFLITKNWMILSKVKTCLKVSKGFTITPHAAEYGHRPITAASPGSFLKIQYSVPPKPICKYSTGI